MQTKLEVVVERKEALLVNFFLAIFTTWAADICFIAK